MTADPGGSAMAAQRVLLLVPARTYRAADFLLAAARMGLDLVIGSDGALPLGGRPVIPVSPGDPDGSTRRILAGSGPVAAVVAADTGSGSSRSRTGTGTSDSSSPRPAPAGMSSRRSSPPVTGCAWS